MNKFKGAEENTTYTDNGAVALTTSGRAVIDFFFQAGTQLDPNVLKLLFGKAFKENPDWAIRTALWMRDIRGGAGRRANFREILKVLEQVDPELTARVMAKVPELGRFDDLLVFQESYAKDIAAKIIHEALEDNNALCAKWMPVKKAGDLWKRLDFANERAWRKYLVPKRQTVEQDMSARTWEKIEYPHVPSVASVRYQKAFMKHDTVRYGEYVDSLTKGEAKINAGAVYPFQVLGGGNPKVIDAQWDAQENFMGDDNLLPMIDVSGSMWTPVQGSTSALNVAVSLGLYIADKQQGDFHDLYLTFSERPTIETLKGTSIVEKARNMKRAHWGMSTNIEAAYTLVLDRAVAHNVVQKEMPKYLLVLSDMQFDPAQDGGTISESLMRAYKAAGYEMPKMVWWNLVGTHHENSVPVTATEDGNVLVSGFSTAILRSVLKAEKFNPLELVLDVILQDRYSF